MSTPILKRDVADEIETFLRTDEIIVIHGARQVGKTSIMMYLQSRLDSQGEQTHYIDLEDSRTLRILDQGVDEFLLHLKEQGFDLASFQNAEKKIFILIDEIQYMENPSSFLKLLADHHRYLKVIVSGSSSFEIKSKFKNSLAGRTVNFEIHPLSFLEFLRFREVPFEYSERYTEKKINELQSLYREFALYGGYPKIVLTAEVSSKERYLQQIVDTYIRKDIRDLAEIKDIHKFNRLLEALASQSGNLVNVSELSNTCGLNSETAQRYLFLLEQTYILRLVKPYSRNIRSEITKTPKVFFYDTGLMQLLWLKRLPQELLGAVYETSIFSELVKRYGIQFVHYWRTTDKQEIDFVVNLPTELRAYEVKSQFPRGNPSVFSAFQNSYPAAQVRLVGLNGESASPDMIHPWSLFR